MSSNTITNNAQKKRAPTRSTTTPAVDAPKTAATNPPRENRTEPSGAQTTLFQATRGCESFPEFPGLIEVTIIIWPWNTELEAHVDVYAYSVHPEYDRPDLCHGEARRDELPKMEGLGSLDRNRVGDFLDNVEDALEELIQRTYDDWNDDPDCFRESFVKEMGKLGWKA
ncbi:hypothetical protein BJY00DRAFT_319203 [Aspergillus carlsbadensis]|nr:hypothetical protein BJY00DRAFT_319203 [Aspergillus carlsbadensis]